MPIFGFKIITEVKGRETFYQLTINDSFKTTGKETPDEINAKKTGVLDDFENSLETKYQKDLRGIYTYMNLIAQGSSVSKEKFKDITPDKEKVKEYEFKHGDLRVYAIKTEGGKIIMLAGYKNKQKDQIKKFRSLKKQYLLNTN